MHITRVSIDNVPPLGHVEFDCDDRVNVFIGPNASGKSTILWAINRLAMNEMVADEEEVADEEDIDEEDIETTWDRSFKSKGVSIIPSEDWPWYDYGHVVDTRDVIPFLYIPATRVNLGKPIFGETINTPEDVNAGTPLERSFGIYNPDTILRDFFDTDSGIFYGQYVERVIDRLRDESTLNRIQRDQFRRALDIGYSCARRICPEVMHDDISHIFVKLDESGRTSHYGMGIGTNDNVMGEPLHASVLSSGTQSTLLWIYALALKMAHHYNWKEGWGKKPAILLIDEIENHLHPTWQRRVIPALLEHFPGLQIFATTHSPFMVAGLKAGQVHLLKRDSGVVTASTYERDVIGWTMDEILRAIMDVDEPTDQLTVDRANQLRQLREKETLTPEEESILNALRRQVNEALLSRSGPVEAQRERYADLMKRFLLSRQSDLTQDGE